MTTILVQLYEKGKDIPTLDFVTRTWENALKMLQNDVLAISEENIESWLIQEEGGRMQTFSMRDLKEKTRKEVKAELREEYNKKIEALEDLKVMQAYSTDETDPYMVGLYNGLELACSVISNREPKFHEVRMHCAMDGVSQVFKQAISKANETSNSNMQISEQLEESIAEFIKQLKDKDKEESE